MGELTTIRTLAGLDLGQRDDFSALAILQEDSADDSLTLVGLERIRYRPYPEVAALVRDTMAALNEPMLLVDVTGIGRPVTDQLAALEVGHTRINIHGGNAVSRLDDGTLSVPKRDLIAALVVGFESGRLKIAAGLRHVEHLEREAQAFTMKLSASGHDSYNAREGEHDDLLLAVALPVWHVLMPRIAGAGLVLGKARGLGAGGGPDRYVSRNGGPERPARRRISSLSDLFS